VQEQIVRTGQVVGEQVEVTEGLAEGDVVAVGTSARLADGRHVRAPGASSAATKAGERPTPAGSTSSDAGAVAPAHK
jgi:hypothetical protein